MYQVRPSVEAIERLLADGSLASLTYAALECRLAIEMICYERLRNSHDYISQDDLRKWQPRDVINQLISDVDDKTAETFTMSVARGKPETDDAAGFKKMEWLPLGSQIGFNPRKIGELWNALSGVALHVRLPKSKDDFVSIYGDGTKIREKVTEALTEIRRISQGELISSGWGAEVSFTCVCGQTNRRRAGLLKQGKVISCINPACEQSFECLIEDNEIIFKRRVIVLPCGCENGLEIPQRRVDKLKASDHITATCESCGKTMGLWWQLMQGMLAEDVEPEQGGAG